MLRKKMRLCDESGASMVEFAIVLPLLLLILFGTIEFGLLLYNKQVITNASREGARFGIVSQETRKTQSEIRDEVNKYCLQNLITFGDNKDPQTSFPEHSLHAAFQDDLTVLVAFEYSFLVLTAFMPNDWTTVNLNAQTTMKYE